MLDRFKTCLATFEKKNLSFIIIHIILYLAIKIFPLLSVTLRLLSAIHFNLSYNRLFRSFCLKFLHYYCCYTRTNILIDQYPHRWNNQCIKKTSPFLMIRILPWSFWHFQIIGIFAVAWRKRKKVWTWYVLKIHCMWNFLTKRGDFLLIYRFSIMNTDGFFLYMLK